MCILQLKVKEICSLLLLHLTRFLSSTDQLLLVPSELSEGRKEREREMLMDYKPGKMSSLAERGKLVHMLNVLLAFGLYSQSELLV